jgi:putative ABC transport system permease protein
MRWHHRLYVTLRGWFRSSELDHELNQELAFHFDRQVQANLDAGMPLEQARRAAALSVGNPETVREASRDGRAGALARQFGRDVAFGARLLRKTPGFAASAIVIIALGIGSVTAIFSVVYGVVLKPLPFHEPDRLVQLWGRYNGERDGVNGADHRDWRAANTVFTDIALVNNVANFNLTGVGEPERLLGARLSANLLPVLGVSPMIGRNFTDDEDDVGNNNRVVLLSHALWQRRFASDPSIVGQSIALAGTPHEVVGVMGPDFQYPGRHFQFWIPLTIDPAEMARKIPAFGLWAIARLKDGETIESAQSQMTVLARGLEERYPMNKGVGVEVVNLQSDLVANVRGALYVMLAAVSALLLVAALNLAGLLSARAAARSRELAVRLALGASRQRVLLQTLAEVVPILAAGGAFGVVAAWWATRAFAPLAPPNLPRDENIAVDTTMLLFSIVVLAIAGVVACVLPAIQAWKLDLTSATRDDSRSSIGSARHTRARHVLVVSQIALSLPLLTAAVLLTKTFAAVTAIDPGFTTDNIVSVHLAIPRSKYRDDPAIARFERAILQRLQSLPGVTSAGMVNRLPLSGGAQMMWMEFDRVTAIERHLLSHRIATPGYFATLGIPLLEGRTFSERDTLAAPVVAIVDERVAKQMWPGESAVGKRLRMPERAGVTPASPWMDVIGVVGHVKHNGLDVEASGHVYWNYEQRTQDRAVYVVRTATNAASLIPSIVRQVRDLDPDQPVYDVRLLDEVLDRSVGQRWLAMALVGAFATMSLLLCCIGVYGVIAFGVARQQREFGIRLALGATRAAVTRAVVGRGVVLATIGIALGAVLAALVTRGMQSLLFGVTAGDASSFAAAIMALLAISLIASYLPARRAADVDPSVTLRAE